MTGTLVLFSGSLDSTVLLTRTVLAEGPGNVHALSVDYGQRHARELLAADSITRRFAVKHNIADLFSLAPLLSSALTDRAMNVPEGHYADASMAATVVPNRNAIMLMVAAGVAQTRGLLHVVTAVHAGDHPIYKDCRPEFIDAASACARQGTDVGVTIGAPFVHMTKTDIVREGHALGAPMSMSWSCYQGGAVHCGRCGTCVERKEAFRNAGCEQPDRLRRVNPYVIVGCGAAKRDEPTAAGDLYVGGYVRCAITWARSVTLQSHVLILSAQHGLISSRRVISPYNCTWDSPHAVSTDVLALQVRSFDGLQPPAMLLASPRYAQHLAAAGLDSHNPFAHYLHSTGRDMRRGYQMQAMKAHHARLPEQP